jgi:hypothetical protein
MTIDQWLSASLDVISLLGFVVVIIQLRDSNLQTKLGSQIRIYDINRELISLGFSKPELFSILKDADVDPTIERRYLQLRLNQLCLVYSFKRSGTFAKEDQEGFETDLRDMMKMKNMRRHWGEFEKYYPASFRRFVNDLLRYAGHKRTRKKARAITS